MSVDHGAPSCLAAEMCICVYVVGLSVDRRWWFRGELHGGSWGVCVAQDASG